jgi:hypothetical protein
MKPVREIVSRDVIEDLWGAGYTILPRARHPDPFHVPPEMVPQSRSYQWMHLVHDKMLFETPKGCKPNAWAPVPASRHDGYFMPAGHVGDIEVNGLGLFEKPKFEVEAERASQVAAAHKQVDDWKEKWGGTFSGEVSTNGEKTFIGETKTIESTTAIPRDMVPYIAQIFEERDYLGKLYADTCASDDAVWLTPTVSAIATEMEFAMKSNPDAPEWPTLNGIILPYAIENVRKRITEEAASGKAS